MAHIAEPPIAAADAPPDVADRQVVVEGIPQWDRVMLVVGKYMFGQPGYQVILPVTSNGEGFLVDIGWIPADEADLILQNERAIVGVRHYAGLARQIAASGERRWFFPVEQGYQRRWGDVEPVAMSREAHIKERSWVLVDGKPLAAEEEIQNRVPPISGWRAVLELPPHLNYAITWFSLAILVCVLWVVISFVPNPPSTPVRRVESLPPDAG